MLEISLDIAVTTSLRDDMTKESEEKNTSSVYLHHAAALDPELLSSCSECFYSESTLLYLSLSLKLRDAWHCVQTRNHKRHGSQGHKSKH